MHLNKALYINFFRPRMRIEKQSTPLFSRKKNYALGLAPTCSHNGTALSRRGRHRVVSSAGWARRRATRRPRRVAVADATWTGRRGDACHSASSSARGAPLAGRPAGHPLVLFPRSVAIAVAALTGAGCWPLTCSPPADRSVIAPLVN